MGFLRCFGWLADDLKDVAVGMQVVVVDADGEFDILSIRLQVHLPVYVCLSTVEDEDEEAVSSTVFSVNFTSV